MGTIEAIFLWFSSWYSYCISNEFIIKSPLKILLLSSTFSIALFISYLVSNNPIKIFGGLHKRGACLRLRCQENRLLLIVQFQYKIHNDANAWLQKSNILFSNRYLFDSKRVRLRKHSDSLLEEEGNRFCFYIFF